MRMHRTVVYLLAARSQVIIGLFAGCVIAAIAGAAGSQGKYLTADKISSAPSITFLWVHTFPIGFYAPSLLPLLIGFIVTTVEAIGDVTATCKASELEEDLKVRTACCPFAIRSRLRLRAVP